MNTPVLVQTVVISAMVGWSALFAARRFLPVASRRAQAKLADAFDRRPFPAWLRAAAQRVQPRATSGGRCGDGCSSCGGCATEPPKRVVEAQPLTFRSRGGG
ncbi:MAG: DUF6587 family protein [Dokdonella sp.]